MDQRRNFPYAYTLGLSTASPPVLTLAQYDASTGLTTTVTWTSALLGSRASPAQGSFGWLCTPGRVVEITAESFSAFVAPTAGATVVFPGLDVAAQVDHGGVTTGYPNGYAFARRLARSAQADLAAESTADLPSFLDTTEVPGDWSWLAPDPSLDPGASSAWRPFAASAAWNVPAQALPVDPNSAALCALLWNGADAAVGNCNIEYTDYSFPVYYAAAGTDPNATLPVANDTYRIACPGFAIDGTSVRWHASWAVPAGSDGQVIVLNPSTGQEWDLWQVSVNTSTKVVTCAHGTVLADYRTGDGHNLPSRAIGIQYLAMLVRPWEVAQGRIDHALAMGVINVAKVAGRGLFVAPAISEDATGSPWGTDPGIPEGTRFVWDFTDAQREAWVAAKPGGMRTTARIIANALREYGAVVTDHAGGWHIQLEDRASAGAAWDALGLTDTVATRDLLTGLLTATNAHVVVPSTAYPAFTGKLLSIVGGVPFDVRFQTEGDVKLDHQIVRWDGAGRFFVREPAGARSDTDLRVLVYYGKAGLGVSEENVAGVWRAATLVVDPTTGADLTGRGRTFTRTGALAATTLDGRPAVQAADQTGGYLRRTNADLSIFDGFGAASVGGFTVEYWARIGTASSGNLDRLGGNGGGTARFSSWAEHTGSAGRKADVLQAGANWYNGQGSPNESTESTANVGDGTARHVIVVRLSNAHTQMYDGETNVSSTDFANAPSAGTIHPQSGDNYSLGAGTGAQDTSPGMTMGLYAVWPKGLSATWRAMLDRTQRDSSLCWAVGAEDTYLNADNSPVGRPWRDSINATTTYDLAAHAFDPDAGAVVVATAVTPAADTLAGYSVVAGKLQVAPVPGGPAGVGRPVVTLSDGTKTAKVSPRIAISGGTTTAGGEGLATSFPTAAQSTVLGPFAASALQAAYDALTGPQIAAGVTLLVTPGTSATGGLTLGKSGARGAGADDLHPQFPIVIRPGTRGASGQIVDPAAFPAFTIGGTVNITGAYNWVRGGALRSGVQIGGPGNPRGARLNRCAMTGSGNVNDFGISTSVDWSEIGNVPGVLLARQAQYGSLSSFTYRSWLHDGVGTVGLNSTMEMVGTGNRADLVDYGGLALDCLYGPPGDISEAWEAKSNYNVMRRCTVIGTAAQSLRAIVRHGAHCEIDTLYCGPFTYAGFRGGPHVFADSVNVDSTPPYWGPFTGNISLFDWRAIVLSGVAPAHWYPRGEDVVMHRIVSPILGGTPSSWPGRPNIPPVGSVLLSCTGSPVIRDGALRTTGTSTRPLPTRPARAWPQPTGGAADLIGPMGVYRTSD